MTMQYFTNNHTTTVNSSLEKVWFALTNSDEISKYLLSMKVVSNWTEESKIEYTHYDKNGKITEWNGTKMIWSGIIETLELNKLFTVNYTGSPTGVIKETYSLERVNKKTTKLDFVQTITTLEMADNYKEGNEHSLNALKKYLEN
ncbi:MAG: SRPBCC domain-containing protein [candidate division SR1 bacterium]|nr:SRPBCC domain-containing protein [candidate division SR1 bacterium]